MARCIPGSVLIEIFESLASQSGLNRFEKILLVVTGEGYTHAGEAIQRIAHVASRRKQLGADLIEEVLYDTELRVVGGTEARPMHLQTADMRMPVYKARNWDLMAVSDVVLGLLGGGA
ncbi:hypothetical protein EMGR_007144 [Emarellia grisea]